MEHNEDTDIARAIALSLADQDSHKNADSEDEYEDEDDLLQDTDSNNATKASKNDVPLPSKGTVPVASSSKAPSPAPSSWLSERQQMEKERLERQKRLRVAAGIEEEEEKEEERPAKRQHISSSKSAHTTNSRGSQAAPKPAPFSVPSGNQYFWDGELRSTATQHAHPRKDGKPTFRLSEILGKKSEIVFAIISSFALDISFIYSFFDPSTPVIIVTQPDQTGQASVRNVLPNWVKSTPYLKGGYGCQHMKFMLLFYQDGRIRVVISTANLIPHDWRDLENAVWIQDIPLRSNSSTSTHKKPKSSDDDFPSMMQYVLHNVHVKPALGVMKTQDHPNIPLQAIEDLSKKWDWGNVKAQLIPSIAGKHEGWPSVLKTGHTRLMKAIRNGGLTTDSRKQLRIECQTSSVGNYSTQWLNEFHWSARGQSPQAFLEKPKKVREKMPYPDTRIIFPSERTVKNSVGGEGAGGTIFCRRQQWSSSKFPRELFFDSKSKGGKVLMHTKMILGIISDKPNTSGPIVVESDSDDSDIEIVEPIKPAGWLYVGSHNYTPSAWGTLSGSGFNPVLNIMNYELGILIPVTTIEATESLVCWERPPRKYDLKCGEEAWIQEESPVFQ